MIRRLVRHRRVAPQSFIAGVVLASLASVGSALAEDAAPSVPGQLIVRFKDGLSKSLIDSVNQVVGTNANLVTPADPQLYVVNLPQGMDNAAGMSIYSKLSDVLYVEPNFLYEQVAVPNDPLYPQLWGLRKISGPDAWDITTGDPSIVIADTDTGADYNHEDLSDNVWVNQGEICNNGIDDDNNGYIDDCIGWNFFNNNNDPIDVTSLGGGHGSNTAGIMGAVGNNGIGVTGVMWNAQIMLLKMGNGTFPSTAVVPAIDYAWYNGARIINASWGSRGYSQSIFDAIQRANDAGVLFVAAAGNNGTNNDVIPFYPANFNIPNIISVANTTQFDLLRTGSVPSNWGPNTVHLAAPGTDILSTYPGNRYVAYVGTSQAAPHVAATAGLILSINPFLGPPDVKNIILSSVDPIPSLADKVITGGRLNASAALQITPSP
jgi:subtilisin family serine protease